MTRSLEFLTRASCHLCAEARPIVAEEALRLGWEMAVIDVDEAGLDLDFGDRVPVVLLNGVEVLAGRFGPTDVRQALQ